MNKTIFTAASVLFVALALAQEPELVAYPAKGQAAAQQEKDQAECTQWSRQKSGYEGSSGNAAQAAQAAATTPVRTAAPPVRLPPFPGLSAPPWLPPAPDAQASAATDGSAQSFNESQRELQQRGLRGGQHATYVRALAACMEGRGYVVK